MFIKLKLYSNLDVECPFEKAKRNIQTIHNCKACEYFEKLALGGVLCKTEGIPQKVVKTKRIKKEKVVNGTDI